MALSLWVIQIFIGMTWKWKKGLICVCGEGGVKEVGWSLESEKITQTFTEFNVFQACSDAVVKMIIGSSASASLHCFSLSLCTIPLTDWLQVAFLGVVGGYGVQTSVLVQSLGSIGFIVDVMSHLLQILEVRPERRHGHTGYLLGR